MILRIYVWSYSALRRRTCFFWIAIIEQFQQCQWKIFLREKLSSTGVRAWDIIDIRQGVGGGNGWCRPALYALRRFIEIMWSNVRRILPLRLRRGWFWKACSVVWGLLLPVISPHPPYICNTPVARIRMTCPVVGASIRINQTPQVSDWCWLCRSVVDVSKREYFTTIQIVRLFVPIFVITT